MQLKELSFEIIQRCPNNCIHCSSNSSIHAQSIISKAVFIKTIDDAIQLGVARICISGGEPFLHPDLIEFVSYIKQKGLEVYIYTSGIKFDEAGEQTSLDKQFLMSLHEIGLDKLIFNVQAAEETVYDQVMGTQKCFEKLKASIRNSVDCKVYTELHLVPMKQNYKSIYSVLDMAAELGVKKVSLLRLVLQGRALHNRRLVELSNEEAEELNAILRSLEDQYKSVDIRKGIPLSDNSHYSCNASYGKLIIRYDGAVFPCEAFKYIATIDGINQIQPDNVNEKSLIDIYLNSVFLNTLRGEIQEFKTDNLSCETCPAQWRLVKVITA